MLLGGGKPEVFDTDQSESEEWCEPDHGTYEAGIVAGCKFKLHPTTISTLYYVERMSIDELASGALVSWPGVHRCSSHPSQP